ncbi:chromosome 16 open reading frame 72 [Plakobranchus ocellatus]|uniref:Chromosome 16 open reading frame 72 n=1 Tax=Plakobranchus ocellatus TaxID=259542 RepID=A0AAV4ASN4_9GAST|nr:chromosome 16 open reading frame 72 [Plakobranchus ocellatus]
MACANVPTPSSQGSDSDTIIAGSSGSKFYLDLSSDVNGPNGAQVASTLQSRTDALISGRGTPATDQGVGDFQWQYLVEEEDLNPVEWKINYNPQTVGVMSSSEKYKKINIPGAASQDGCHVLMVPFNKAAESLTKFYKDSLINARECLRLGVQSGRNSRARDIAAWARKKRKCIRREELLAYLCGRSIPAHAHHHPRSRQNRSIERQIPWRSHQSEAYESGEYPVRDALSLQGLNGAMSNISMGYNRPGSTTSSSTSMSRTPAVVEEILFHHHHHHDDLANWGCTTDHHHSSRKRHGSSSATDVNMESPSRKRGKYL